jgi:hypothetical protein
MSDQKQLPLDCQQSKMTLKALRAEAKKTGVKNYSKLSRDFLIDAIAKQTEQNNISDAVALFAGPPETKVVFDTDPPETKEVFDTGTPEAKGQPEPVPAVTTIPSPLTPVKKERKTRKKKSKDPDCSLTVVHVDKPKDPEEEPAPKKKGPNKWQLHVQAFRSEHPELSYKNAMTEAKKTYQAFTSDLPAN